MKKAAQQRRARLLRLILIAGFCVAALLNIIYFTFIGKMVSFLPARSANDVSYRGVDTARGASNKISRALSSGAHAGFNSSRSATVKATALVVDDSAIGLAASWPIRTATALMLCVDTQADCLASSAGNVTHLIALIITTLGCIKPEASRHVACVSGGFTTALVAGVNCLELEQRSLVLDERALLQRLPTTADEGGRCACWHTYGMQQCVLVGTHATCMNCGSLAAEVSSATSISTEVVQQLSCVDADEGCAQQAGLCANQLDLALAHCKATCKLCDSSGDAQVGAPAAAAAVTTPAAGSPCRDYVDLCPYWAAHLKQCAQHWWMPRLCGRSCGACAGPGVTKSLAELTTLAEPGECVDYHAQCPAWAQARRCRGQSSSFMLTHCARSCNQCGQGGGEAQEQGAMRIQLGVDHKGRDALSHFQDTAADKACVDGNVQCSGWAALGECEKNPKYMSEMCARACRNCTVSSWLFRPLAQVRLNNGVLMPSVGYGSAALGDQTGDLVALALRSGYTHIDTAQAAEWYREDLVGEAVSASGIDRSLLFLTTKLHPKHHGYASTLSQFESSLRALRTEYIDLFLLHYPECFPGLAGCPDAAAAPPPMAWKESWRALEELYSAGKVRAIGVSNFDAHQAQLLMGVATIRPAVLQVHLDPFSSAPELRNWCAASGVQLVGYSTLGTQWGTTGTDGRNPVLTDPAVVALARELKRSPAQVVLRWALQLGVLVIPRSSNEGRLMQNKLLWDFSLTEEQMSTMGTLHGTKPS